MTRDAVDNEPRCLDPEVIDAFIRGETATPRETIEEHIAGCTSCRELLSALVKLESATSTSTSASSPAGMSTRSGVPGASAGDDVELALGSRIGRYIVGDRLGEGGMGVVYSAHDSQLDRNVALKLLRSDFSEAEQRSLRERLRREARAMAQMAHPNVVTIHDAETWADRMFIVMELVEGQTLEKWLADGRRPWREVVDTCLAAGQGLAAAHRAGIVHRDFKPANVLIGKDGRVRVVDFGLAAITPGSQENAGEGAGRLPLSISQSTMGPFVGTPYFMAPEQLFGRSADARSDQFSFCVTLYLALTGEHPFAGDLRAGRFSPTRFLDNLMAGRVNPAPAHAPVPRWCRQALLRGLRVRPEERFPSMEALLAVLSRHATRRRRRIAVTSSLAVFMAGAAAYAVLFQDPVPAPSLPRCDVGAERLAGVWNPARRGQVQAAFAASGVAGAEGVWNRFATNLDRRTASWVAMYNDACAATHLRGVQSPDVLDLRVECLDRSLQELKAVVDVYSEKLDKRAVDRAQDTSESLSLTRGCADAASLRAVVAPPDDPAIRPKVQDLRGRLGRAWALYYAGRYAEGSEYATALKREADALGYAPLAAEVGAVLGRHLIRMARRDQAEEVLFEAAAKAVSSRAWLVEAEAAVSLADNFVENGRANEGMVAIRSAELALERANQDDLLRRRLTSLRGTVALLRGNFEEALTWHGRAAELGEAAVGPGSRFFALALANMGNDLIALGRIREGVKHIERSLEIHKQVARPDHPAFGHYHTSLGISYGKLGMHRRSLESHRQAYEIRLRELGRENPETIWALVNMSIAESNLGNYTRALDLAAQVESLDKAIDPDNAFRANAYLARGEIQLRAGRHQDASESFHRALRHAERVSGPNNPNVGFALVDLGLLDNLRRRHRPALDRCRRGAAILVAQFKETSSELAVARSCIGEALIGAGDAAGARTELERALAVIPAGDASPRDLAALRFHLARALWSAPAERRRAHDLASEALAALRAAEGDQRDLIAAAEAWLKSHPEPGPG